jgi:hypothetical protein
MSFYTTYKKTVITSIIGVFVVGVIPGISWLHVAWADGRYVQQNAVVLKQMSDINDTLFEIDQDIVEAASKEDPTLKAKLKARKEYYERKKDELEKELDEK